MNMVRIFKSKYYLCTKEGNFGYRVRLDIGPFDTESKALTHMYQPDPTDRHASWERKSEFAGTITAKGSYILNRPRVYKLTEEQPAAIPGGKLTKRGNE